MAPSLRSLLQGGGATLALVLPLACSQSPPNKPPAPSVVVAEVKQATVPVYLEFVGRTAAIRSVDIRARVEGYLTKREFTEGTDAEAGQLLYQIDPRPFQYEVIAAKGVVEAARAAAEEARAEANQYTEAFRADAVSREDYDRALARAESADGRFESAQARLRHAQLQLDWSAVTAPFAGRIGRTEVHVGNLVGTAGDKTLLAQLVQLDPIYVYFSPSDREAIEIFQVQSTKEIADPSTKKLVVTLLRKDLQSDYPHPGELTFVDNVMDPDTGTVAMRATVPNPDYRLLPGLVVDVRLHLKEQPDALLVPKEAIKSLQGESVVLVVGPDDKVEQRKVELGPAYEDKRVVKSGLKAGQRVIAEGLQKVRAGMQVTPRPAVSVGAGPPGDSKAPSKVKTSSP